MLEAKNLSVAVAGEVYLDDVSFTAEQGRIYVIMGRTGAGKTSLMRAVSGLLPLDQGTVSFRGEDITFQPVWKRDAAMVYQQFINYPNKTVRQNVEFPLKKAGLKEPELSQRVDSYLSKVGLTDFASRRPSQLSGGQQQRVALARSLARHSRILMLDEPLMNLDFKLREQLREEFLDLFSGENESVTLYATTEITEAMMLGYELIVMHEGRILQVGRPAEVFERPKNTLVAQIVNDPPMSVLSGRVENNQVVLGSGHALALPPQLSALGAGNYQFGIRANDIVPAGAGGSNTETCTITFVELSGSETVLYVSSESGDLVVQIEGIHDFVAGEQLNVSIRADRLFAFDTDGQLLAAPGVGVK
jgi:glycerol transport system ATP-binding protein